MELKMADKYPTEADIEVLKKLGLPVPGSTTTKKDEE
jgi:hypothetical protein|tara:strand:- start:680 stop:790 length:111 start_codon:yes stop_codon:yes gene_type:complete